jgi:hypothetical protein
VRSEADVIACHRYLGRIASRTHLVNIPKNDTSSSSPLSDVPLGRTPPYLDPQSQEAVHEVDVSGMPIHINFNWNQSGHTEGSMDEGRMYE